MNDGRCDVHISTAPRSSLVWIFPLGKRESCTSICSNCGERYDVRGRATLQIGWDTDEHLSVVNGIGVPEGIKESSDSRVLHVEGETGVGILELLDDLGAVVFLGGRVRTRVRARALGLHRIPFGNWGETWT